MVFSKKRILLIVIFVIAFLVFLCKPVFGEDIKFKYHKYDEPSDLLITQENVVDPNSGSTTRLCTNHGKALLAYYLNPDVVAEDYITYTNNASYNTIEPSLGYATYIIEKEKASDRQWKEYQNIGWASKNWSNNYDACDKDSINVNLSDNPTSQILEYRTRQYGIVYQEIFSKLKENQELFKIESQNAKVLVNQADGSYILGPYTMSLNVSNSSQEANGILYNELLDCMKAKQNPQSAYSNSGYTADYRLSGGTENINKYGKLGNGFIDITGIQIGNIEGTCTFLSINNQNNNQLSFPNFTNNSQFYIRVKPTNSDTVIDSTNATLKINFDYLKGFKAPETWLIKRYKVKEVEFDNYSGKGNDIYVNKEYIDAQGNKITEVNLFNNSNASTVILTNDMTSNKGNKITDLFQDIVIINPNLEPIWASTSASMNVNSLTTVIGGNVWQDVKSNDKANIINGIRNDNESGLKGIQVQLYDLGILNTDGLLSNEYGANGQLSQTTTTDENGNYKFTGLNPLKKYYIIFTYNGQMYESTYYKNKLTGGYSNATDINRDDFNKKFSTINSSDNNYRPEQDGLDWYKSYSLKSILIDDDGNNTTLTYQSAWEKFIDFATEEQSYSDTVYDRLIDWLVLQGTSISEGKSVAQFIKDCMITSTTRVKDPLNNNKEVTYPIYNTYVLNDADNPTPHETPTQTFTSYKYLFSKSPNTGDQSRYVDYGITARDTSDLALNKDIYKATLIINGKKEEYIYNKKGQNENIPWDITDRVNNDFYNGNYNYSREIYSSDYLYDASKIYPNGDVNKNLQVYITYLIKVKNQGAVDTTVDEIIDYYDKNVYEYCPENTYSYVGNNDGTYKSDLMKQDYSLEKGRNLFVEESKAELKAQNYDYQAMYLSSTQTENKLLHSGDTEYIYITFKVKNDETGKIKLDENVETGELTIGKRNLAEINGYSTYYPVNAKIPSYLDSNDKIKDLDVSLKEAGLIDQDSNPGNLTSKCLDDDGNLIMNKVEDDTDKAPNIKFKIKQTTRSISGYTYEDTRNTTSDKAVVGNGIYDNGDTLINGVTVELVELVQDVNEHGIATGSYSGEYVWSTKQMSYDANNKKWVLSDNSDRYYSGSKKAKTILSGTGILNVDDSTTINDGEYSFLSVPTGDFFVRFTYGDTNQTVLVKSNEVTSLINEYGLNDKSYNGQDYKSTTYQSGISQNGSYNGINGYTDFENQNYTSQTEMNNVPNKSSMYLYDIAESSKVQGASDAKDVYSYRDNANKYSQGELLNNKAEILDSWEKIQTYRYTDPNTQKNEQKNMINELINRTKMVAQTGVINTEIEYNTTKTDNQGDSNLQEYQIEYVDLGLEERPEAQLKLTKSVSNFKLTLANGQILFNTNQSVNNLYYANHAGHSTSYIGYRMNTPSINKKNTTDTPELIQCYMDDELMEGAEISVEYTITVENVGEIDYLDKQFYYTGKTAKAEESNISTTNANMIIDYISNMIQYDNTSNSGWEIKSLSDLYSGALTKEAISSFKDNLVNRKYYDELKTYNTIITSNKLSQQELYPKCYENSKDSASQKLAVLTTIISNNKSNNLTYNNLSEIIKTSNTQGRRMQYSIVGNQPMADQSLGNNASKDVYSSTELVTPTEIDADSAQKISILPPTGLNKNVSEKIITVLIGLIILSVAILIIKEKILYNKYKI